MHKRPGFALAGLVLGVVSSIPVFAAQAAVFAVDRQGDAYTLATPAVYTPQPGHIYVGEVAGQEESHALAHVDLSQLDRGATVSKLVLSVKDDVADAGNLQPASAALNVCRLAGDFVAGRQQGSGPTVDCAKPVAGTLRSDGSWAFDLTAMASDWITGANHGIALAAQSTPGATWRLALKTSLTQAAGAVTPPAAQSAPEIAPAPAPAPAAAAPLPPVVFPPLQAPPLALSGQPPPVPAAADAGSQARSAIASGAGEIPPVQIRLPYIWLVLIPAIAAAGGFAMPPLWRTARGARA